MPLTKPTLVEVNMADLNSTLTAERLRELLDYDPETGIFTWRERSLSMFASERDCRAWNTRFAAKSAGYKGKRYTCITLDGRPWLAHRLAWLYVNGNWPTEIDHINRDKHDNCLKNLRVATHAENKRNCAKCVGEKTSRFKNVSFKKQCGKWAVKVEAQGRKYRKYFDDEIEAANWAAKMREKLHKEFACHE